MIRMDLDTLIVQAEDGYELIAYDLDGSTTGRLRHHGTDVNCPVGFRLNWTRWGCVFELEYDPTLGQSDSCPVHLEVVHHRGWDIANLSPVGINMVTKSDLRIHADSHGRMTLMMPSEDIRLPMPDRFLVDSAYWRNKQLQIEFDYGGPIRTHRVLHEIDQWTARYGHRLAHHEVLV